MKLELFFLIQHLYLDILDLQGIVTLRVIFDTEKSMFS